MGHLPSDEDIQKGIRVCTKMAVEFLRNAAADMKKRSFLNIAQANSLEFWADEIEAGKHLALPSGEEK